jgi:hypothetical protein
MRSFMLSAGFVLVAAAVDDISEISHPWALAKRIELVAGGGSLGQAEGTVLVVVVV